MYKMKLCITMFYVPQMQSVILRINDYVMLCCVILCYVVLCYVKRSIYKVYVNIKGSSMVKCI